MDSDTLAAALQRELDGYNRRGMKERANAVRQELIRLGCSPVETAGEVVSSESDSTPTKPARRLTKPVEAVKETQAPKAPAKRKKVGK